MIYGRRAPPSEDRPADTVRMGLPVLGGCQQSVWGEHSSSSGRTW